MGKTPLSCQQGCYAAKSTSGMQPTARKQNYPNRLNRFWSLHAVHIKDRLCHRKKPAFNHVKTMTLHTLCGIHAGKGNEQETIMDYKTSKLYKQNEKVILFIQPSYGNSNRIKFV